MVLKAKMKRPRITVLVATLPQNLPFMKGLLFSRYEVFSVKKRYFLSQYDHRLVRLQIIIFYTYITASWQDYS
jgi:hypothetical protein